MWKIIYSTLDNIPVDLSGFEAIRHMLSTAFTYVGTQKCLIEDSSGRKAIDGTTVGVQYHRTPVCCRGTVYFYNRQV